MAKGRRRSCGSRCLEAENDAQARKVARAIANSPLVKTCMHGGDPNWGRIISSAGAAMAGHSLPKSHLHLCGVLVVEGGAAAAVSDADRDTMAAGMKEPEIDIALDLGLGAGAAQIFFAEHGTRVHNRQRRVPHIGLNMREVYRKRVETLLESLPYIRMFSGTTMVIKYGGAAMSSADLKDEFATDIALLRYVGIKPIIVHGGGNEISSYMKRLDLPVKFVEGLRVTDAAAMEVAKMVLVGKVNKEIVSLINSKGAAAVGLCGDDGSLLRAQPLVKRHADGTVIDLGLVLARSPRSTPNCWPSWRPITCRSWPRSERDRGESYNINADTVAGALAAALKAEKVIFLTDVSGLHSDLEDDSTLISQCTARDIVDLMEGGKVSKGMIPKLEAVLTSLRAGVAAAHIIDGRIAHSVLLEVMTDDAGLGTKIVSGADLSWA